MPTPSTRLLVRRRRSASAMPPASPAALPTTADPASGPAGAAVQARPVPGAWGWRRRGAGRAAHVDTGTLYQATTVQLCGLYPFAQGSGAKTFGVPMGRHLHTAEPVGVDPGEWLRGGLVTNTGLWIQAQPGVGKALAVDTPIPTPTGWAPMGVLQPDDAVFDEHGRPTTVVAVSEVMHHRECWELTFSDGSTIVADADHLWVTETVAARQRTHTARLRPPTRRPLRTPVEIAGVEAALVDGPREATTSVLGLARELGWSDSRRRLLHDWAQDLMPTPAANERRWPRWDRRGLLEVALARLRASMHDQRATIPPAAPITTRHLASTLRAGGKLNHAIPVAGALDLPEAVLPVPPRLLGLWLGDGSSHAARFTSADPELLDEFTAAGWSVRHVGRCTYQITAARRADGTVTRRSASTFTGQLRALGVLGHKHIPPAYLRASTRQRHALLSGLLDTDGTVAPSGQVQYTSTNQQLAYEVYDLVCTLGYRPTLRQGRARLDGHDHGPQWTAGFTTTDDVFGLARKRAAHRRRMAGRRMRPVRRYVIDARLVPSRPVRCIQVANPSGLFLAGRSFIAAHNSTFAKRLGAGLVAFGTRLLSLGDTKGEYSALVGALDGQVVTIGRGLDRINPLDSGPIGQLLRTRGDQLGRQVRDELADQVRARRLIMLEALCAIVRHRELREDERVLLGVALDRHLQATPHGEPTVGEIHRILTPADPDPGLIAAAHTADAREYRSLARPLLHTMELLRHGSIKGLFDGPSTTSIRMDAPAVSLDISHLDDQDDDAVAAAMLCSWAWGSSMVDAARAAGERTTFYMILDEMWRALRAAPGLVERADRLTRLNRWRGVISAMITHSLDDLEALPTEQDRAKARGLIDRCGTVVLGGLPPKELERLAGITPLTSGEAALVTSWAAPPTWVPGVAHPGRGRYLIKSGERMGIPLRLDLVEVERGLYDTDRAWHERPALAGGHLAGSPDPGGGGP
jgi:hypothetical protein